MGIFDPKLDSEILPTDEVQRAAPSPFVAAAGSLLGSATEILRDATRGSGSGSRKQKNTVDYRPLNEAFTDAEVLREEGKHEAARQKELAAIDWAHRAGFDLDSPAFKENYTRVTGGRNFDELGLTPDQQMVQGLRDHDMWDTKVRTSNYLHPDWTQSQHEEWAAEELMKLDAATHNRNQSATEFYNGGGAEIESIVGGVVADIEAKAMEFGGTDGLDLGELQQLDAQITTALSSFNRPEGVAEEAWNQRLAKLTTMHTAIKGAMDSQTPEAIEKRQIAAIYRVMSDAGISPIVQQGIAKSIAAGDFDKALDALKRTNLDVGVKAEAEFLKSMATGVSVALGHSIESKEGDRDAVEGNPTSVQRSVAGYGQDPTGRNGKIGSDMPDDIKYVTGNKGANDRTPEENLEVVDALSKNLEPGSMSETSLGNTLLAIADQTFNATVGIQGEGGRHFDGVPIKDTYGGKFSAAAEKVAKGNPALASQAYNAGALALRAQVERSRQDTYETIETNPFLVGKKDGRVIVGVDLDEQAVFDRLVARQGPAAAQEFDNYAKKNGGYLAVLSSPIPEDLRGTPTEAMIKLNKSQLGPYAEAANRLGQQIETEDWMEGRADFMTKQWRRHADAAGLFAPEDPNAISTTTIPDMKDAGGDLTKITGFQRIAEDSEFLEASSGVAERLGMTHHDLLTAISFETVGSFSPSIKNPGSTATGLIQFLEDTAKSLGTSTAELSKMTATEQLPFVEKYLAREFKRKGVTNPSFGDVYMAIHWPEGIGKPDSYVMYKKGTQNYEKNSSLDTNGDGTVTRGEAVAAAAASGSRGGAGISGNSGAASGATEASTEDDGILEALPDTVPITSPTPRDRASAMPAETEALFSEGGEGFTAEQAQAVREKFPNLDNSIALLDTDVANAVILNLVGKLEK